MPPLLRRILPLLAAVAALVALFGTCVPDGRFLTTGNLIDLVQQISVNAILAFGMTLVILIGGIDLSVGALLALVGTATTFALLPQGWHLPPFAAFGSGIGIALVFGLFHGIAAAKTPMPPFIITLATMLVARGLALRFNEGKPMGIPDSESFLLGIGNGRIADSLPIPVAIMFVVWAITAAMLHFTVFGRHLYAIGASRMAAIYSGIRVARCEVMVYAGASLLTAIAGLIHTSQLYSAEPASGEGFELNAIAAAVVGGASFKGGRGTMTGTLIGAVIIGILDKGLNQMGVHFSYQRIIKGAVILGAVWFDVRRRK
jgi:ribose transport system permease protein